MLDGWYCRSMANMQAEDRARTSQQNEDEYSSDSSQSEAEPEVNYKAQYWTLKKKLKYLIYENECFQDALRSTQKRLIKASRDRSFLLDRLLQYEKPENTSSESDETESSDDPDSNRVEQGKSRKRTDTNTSQNAAPPAPVASKNQAAVKRKRPPVNKKAQQNNVQSHHMMAMPKANSALGMSMAAANAGAGDGHMTPEEVERHLQSRQSYLELLPERAPPTVPTEMFSNDPSLDSESNDILENSPNIGDEWIE